MNLKVFDDMRSKIEQVPAQMPVIFQEEMRALKPFILDLNKDQLARGKNSDETPIQPAYKPYTVQVKKKKGQESRWVTLEDTGKFKRGMDGFFTKSRAQLFSRDSKSERLIKKYGEKIFGLPSSRRSDLKNQLTPRLINRVKKIR